MADRLRTSHRARRAIKRGDDAVTCWVDSSSAMTFKLAFDERVMVVEKPRPPFVTELRGMLRGTHDVGEQHRRQGAINFTNRRRAGDELFDVIDEIVRVFREE